MDVAGLKTTSPLSGSPSYNIAKPEKIKAWNRKQEESCEMYVILQKHVTYWLCQQNSKATWFDIEHQYRCNKYTSSIHIHEKGEFIFSYAASYSIKHETCHSPETCYIVIMSTVLKSKMISMYCINIHATHRHTSTWHGKGKFIFPYIRAAKHIRT